jgi:hypothetical protein
MHIVRRGTADTRRYRTHAYKQATTDDGGGPRRGPHCGRTVLRSDCLSAPTDEGSFLHNVQTPTGATAPAICLRR